MGRKNTPDMDKRREGKGVRKTTGVPDLEDFTGDCPRGCGARVTISGATANLKDHYKPSATGQRVWCE